jgi:NADH-quinone oxidoreductase subunit H
MNALFAIEPSLTGDLFWAPIVIVVLKVLVVFVIGLVATMFMVWFERRVVAGMQNRIGPNKTGPFGLLQTLADGTKLFFKEDLIPDRADRFVFRLAPFMALVPAFLSFAIIPLGGDFRNGNDGLVTWFGVQTRIQLADPPMGVLFALAISSIAVYGVMLAGWSSGSKYPLLGSVRATAQMVSYEAALGLSLAAVIIVTGTLSTSGIVGAQGTLGNWNVVATGVVPLAIFLIAATAELNRPPFDLVEAEQELVGGFHTEYSSIRFALFFLAEFMNTVTMSAVIVTLFLGGPTPPMDKPSWIGFSLPEQLHVVWPVLWFVAKVFIFLFTYVWLRATLPRFRYDQLMDLGWKRMIPIGLAWVLLIAAVQAGNGEMADVLRNLAIVITAVVLSAFVLIRAMRLGTSRYQEVGAPGDEHVAADGVLTEEHN